MIPNLTHNLVLRISALGLWLGATTPARAAVLSVNAYPSAQQDTSDPSKADAVILVQTRSSTSAFQTLTYAGGFDLTCPESIDSIHPSGSAQSPGNFATDLVTNIVVPQPQFPYHIAGYESWATPSTHWCTMEWKADAMESSLSISVNAGSHFSLQVGGGDTPLGRHDTLTFPMTKSDPCDDGFTGSGVETNLIDTNDGDGHTCDPLVLDLGMDGIDLGPPGVGVRFDMNADGDLDHMQWLRRGGDEGFLVLDRNGNGAIDNGSELFGVGTPLVLEGRKAPNGFVALAQYDEPELGGDGDGRITRNDDIWYSLAVWVDRNADGISTPDEIRPLSSTDIVSLPTITRAWRQTDRAGNFMPYRAEAMTRSHRRMRVAEVMFQLL